MKIPEFTNKALQQAGAAPIGLVAWDFVKMLAVAILCGLAVSIVAAGITLLLTGNAEARLFQKEGAANAAMQATQNDTSDSDELSPTPGALLLGDGCDSFALDATERDWQVRIDGKRIEVRVMQTFQLPADASEVATFHVQLLNGARLQSLAVQSSSKDWTGQVMSADEYERLTQPQFLRLSRNWILASQSPRGTVMTSPLLGLKPNEQITIEYTYAMTLAIDNGLSALNLPLGAAVEYAAIPYPAIYADSSLSASVKPSAPIRGSVWVEWIGKKPAYVTGLPDDTDLEISKSKVDGFSWTSPQIRPGANFQFAWMP